ncbi:MAG: helix-turn-helix domain-containing protein [Enterococcus faecalis]|uniref:helix-turn-helix domain-containing protein n=1 Tax=Enterococcus faecalis TaxID=1351 RepID=UPI0006688F76|nr:helix-turn-helix domain-containing protein [Enterococcus faecalis]AVR92866.1 helix-turn-helix domain-containing protein [Enterococcus faecalis]MBN3024752.1 helix-turn-helix domain-containing protein [Enterococcus faecalis]MBO6313549.1 helix-turn-helix domain-containing protein [Enterococcus faecalis]MCO4112715.1 helix-turn-helix domain-containing protein [Enterococcus faecalis]MDB1632798.1 helix-turn-helix domain-containing protein [Enterococcus faecalis]
MQSALEEDPISIKMILKHYHSYIVKLCLTNGFNEAEQFITYVDEYMLRQLEIKLIEAILKFKIANCKIKLEK